jgi:metallophosphoesterase (TIGR00282 family)
MGIAVLCVGDVAGRAGLDALARLRAAKAKTGADVVIVNGENASGNGMTRADAREIFDAGADVITLGNHAFSKREISTLLDDQPRIIRPYNMPGGRAGSGVYILQCGAYGGFNLAIAALLGRIGMEGGPEASNPFAAADRLLENLAGKADGIIIDFHAEATSEKAAMLFHLAGRVSAVFGTHTHVRTDDARVYNGTGFVTDIGMTGAQHSVIGIDPASSLEYFISDGAVKRYRPATGEGKISGAVFRLSDDGKCQSVGLFSE